MKFKLKLGNPLINKVGLSFHQLALRERFLELEFSWSEFSRIWTRKTPNTDAFHAVLLVTMNLIDWFDMIRCTLVCELYTALLLTFIRRIFNLMAHVESDISSKKLHTWKVMWLHSWRHLKISFIKSVPSVQFSNWYLDRKSLNSMYWQVTVSCTCANFSNFKRRGKSIFLKKSLHKKMKLSIKDFFSKWDQIRRKLHIWSHLLKKSLRENFIFCVV